MVSDQSQDEAEQQPTIGRIPGLIAAVAIIGCFFIMAIKKVK